MSFPAPVLAEVEAWVATPGIDDPSLRDLTTLPFITIDYERSQDLDQALFVERSGDGFVVWYALADAAYYVRPGSALFAEAALRGASFYLPGLTVPMLPAQLSEGIVSLNPGADRRALVFRMQLHADGDVDRTELIRARIHSRAKLTYAGVQAYADGGAEHPFASEVYAESLQLLGVVGELRITRAEDRDVVHYDRVHAETSVAGADAGLVINAGRRNRVEKWNEQVSLLTNIEGARFLRAVSDQGTGLAGLFKVHPAPTESELADFAAAVGDLVDTLGLEATWRWSRDSESLAKYVDRLPDQGPGWRLARALQRQAMIMGEPSRFAVTAAPHHGIGAAAYSRFSAPMREIVGILTHHVAIHQLAGVPLADSGISRALVDDAVVSGNRAQTTQKQVTRDANRLAMDQLFTAELQAHLEERPIRTATVMGMTEQKLYLQLDQPPVAVKLYIPDQEGFLGTRLERVNRLHLRSETIDLRVGDQACVRVRELSKRRDRWVLELLPGTSG